VGDRSRWLSGAYRQIGAESLHPGAFLLKAPSTPYKEPASADDVDVIATREEGR